MNNQLFEIFLGYYHQAVEYAGSHQFKQAADTFDQAFSVLNEIKHEALSKYTGKKVTRVKTPDEVEYDRIKGIVLDLRNQVGDLYLKLEDSELELGQFQIEYNVRVGKYYLQLDQLEYEIQLLKRSLDGLDDKSDSDLNEMAKQLNEDEEQIHADHDSLNAIKDRTRNKTPEELFEIKDLYRNLAKIYHPDKARTDKEKTYFEEVMREINNAYYQHDIDMLRKIEAKAQMFIEIEEIGETFIQKIERLKEEKEKLEILIDRLKRQNFQVIQSDTYQLFIQIKTFDPSPEEYYQSLISDLNRRIHRKQADLIRLKEQTGKADPIYFASHN